MTRFRKSTAAAVAGLGALILLATPSFAAPSGPIAGTGPSAVQPAHMGQGPGSGPGMMSPCQSYGPGPGYGLGPGMKGPGRGFGPGYGMHPGMMEPGYRYGPGRSYGMAPGMMGPDMGGQGMMGPGMMDPGFGRGPGLGGQVVPSRDLTADDVRHFLEHRLEMDGNKRLMVGEVNEADEDKIVADITTVDGSLVERLEVDRHSGAMQHIK